MKRLAILGAALLCGYAAHAETDVGISLICDTAEQAEKFVDLTNDGRSSKEATDAINAKAGSDMACGISGIAFEKVKSVKTMIADGHMVEVVQVRVMAGFDGKKWVPVEPTVQFTVIQVEGDGI